MMMTRCIHALHKAEVFVFSILEVWGWDDEYAGIAEKPNQVETVEWCFDQELKRRKAHYYFLAEKKQEEQEIFPVHHQGSRGRAW